MVLRNGVVLAPALAPVRGEPVHKSLRCRPDAAYLITGGMGALGLLMAGWLADRGARRLVLTGRTALPPRRHWELDTIDAGLREKIDAIRALEMRGVAVEAVAADIGSHDDVQALLAKRDRDGAPPIRGIIHAAGVTNDQLVTNMSDDPVRQVMWPKISGSQALHAAFPPGSVDFFFLIASAAAIFGIPGQGSYAGANSYLDALARLRRQQGCHTLSLDWVAWRGLGFAADAQIVSQELQRMGSRDITPSEAFTAWEYADSYDIAQAVVVRCQRPPAAMDPALRTRTWCRPGTGRRCRQPKYATSSKAGCAASSRRNSGCLRQSWTPTGRSPNWDSIPLWQWRFGARLSTSWASSCPPRCCSTIQPSHHWPAISPNLLHPLLIRKKTTMALLSASAGSVLDSLFDRIESTSPEADGPA